MSDNLTKLFPAKDFPEEMRDTIFQHIFRRLAVYRNNAELYAMAEYGMLSLGEKIKATRRNAFSKSLNKWAQGLLEHAWVVCDNPGGGDCPVLDEFADTSIGDIPPLPPLKDVSRVLNTILLLQLTSSKEYSARTRSFLSSFGPIDERAIVSTIKRPESILEEAQKSAKESTSTHASRGRTLRWLGMGVGAVAGGILVGVTGGLAAPVVGATLGSLFTVLGIGGTAVGVIATSLAGSSVVCAALFGVYGASSSLSMVRRHTREVRDLAIVPVREVKGDESLQVRLCISGWLSTEEDITAPWTVFGACDTFALQWEVEALQELSNALYTVMKTAAMKYVRTEVLRHTLFATLMMSLAPLALLNIGQIMDNPWMNAKALAIKAGAVLGDLLAKRVFGNRPMTLAGYSFGSLVIFEALKHLASLHPSETIGLIEDVYIFGSPISSDPAQWASVRRVIAGRLVNGYSSDDYVLGVLSRASEASWKVSGLHPVDVMGVENIYCEDIDGHTKWRGMIGQAMQTAKVPGILDDEVELQLRTVAGPMERELELSELEAGELDESEKE